MQPRCSRSVLTSVVLLAMCACAAEGDGSLDVTDPVTLKSTLKSGCFAVEGVFDVSAPVAVLTPDGLLFESAFSRRESAETGA